MIRDLWNNPLFRWPVVALATVLLFALMASDSKSTPQMYATMTDVCTADGSIKEDEVAISMESQGFIESHEFVGDDLTTFIEGLFADGIIDAASKTIWDNTSKIEFWTAEDYPDLYMVVVYVDGCSDFIFTVEKMYQDELEERYFGQEV